MSEIVRNSYFKGQMKPVAVPQTERTQIFIGTKCSYKCPFCYYSTMRDMENRPERVLEQLKFVKDYGMLDVEFTGGEPGEDKYILRHIRDAKQLGMRQICVITNGNGFHDEDFFTQAVEAGLNEVLVSLHGFCKVNHNNITGVWDSWDRAVKTMINANKMGLILRINCTVGLINYHSLEQHADFVKQFRPTSVNYLPVNLWGDAARRTIEVSYYVMGPRIENAIDRIKETVPFINVRFIPNCFMKEEYQKYICNWFQHPYDPWDWNNELNDLPKINIRYPNDPFGYAEDVRESIYIKHRYCLHCKYLLVCDGIEKEGWNRNAPHLAAQTGEVIEDPLFARREYCDRETYYKYINTHSQPTKKVQTST